jgi:aromatic ring-opening dioxygenase catalytic subunit (LigB family)
MPLPVIFISHGGGPCFSMEIPGDPFGGLRTYLKGLLHTLPSQARAILLISAHWLEDAVTIGSTARPDMIYDYYGFPPHTYQIRHDARGAPEVARNILRLLNKAGITAVEDTERGLDHGAFVPLMVIDPEATIPVVTMSLRKDLDPEAHVAIGRALVSLRNQGVLILGSGSSFHNLRTFVDGGDGQSHSFDSWLTRAMTDPATREAKLITWEQAPGARAAHPEAEHLLPLMVVAGAAGEDVAYVDFHDVIFGKTISGYRVG